MEKYWPIKFSDTIVMATQKVEEWQDATKYHQSNPTASDYKLMTRNCEIVRFLFAVSIVDEC